MNKYHQIRNCDVQTKKNLRIYRAVDKKSDFITLLQSDYGKIIGEMNVDTQCA